jgi:hypothetical protein
VSNEFFKIYQSEKKTKLEICLLSPSNLYENELKQLETQMKGSNYKLHLFETEESPFTKIKNNLTSKNTKQSFINILQKNYFNNSTPPSTLSDEVSTKKELSSINVIFGILSWHKSSEYFLSNLIESYIKENRMFAVTNLKTNFYLYLQEKDLALLKPNLKDKYKPFYSCTSVFFDLFSTSTILDETRLENFFPYPINKLQIYGAGNEKKLSNDKLYLVEIRFEMNSLLSASEMTFLLKYKLEFFNFVKSVMIKKDRKLQDAIQSILFCKVDFIKHIGHSITSYDRVDSLHPLQLFLIFKYLVDNNLINSSSFNNSSIIQELQQSADKLISQKSKITIDKRNQRNIELDNLKSINSLNGIFKIE